MVFNNPSLLQMDTKDSPIFFGAIFMHLHSTLETFSKCFKHMKHRLGTGDKLTFGTDDEQAIHKVFSQSFPVQPTLCLNHLYTNFTKYLSNITGLGGRIELNWANQLSVIESQDDVEFSSKCDPVLNFCSTNAPKAIPYLQNRLLPILKTQAWPYITQNGEIWTNNNSESGNLKLKSGTGWQRNCSNRWASLWTYICYVCWRQKSFYRFSNILFSPYINCIPNFNQWLDWPISKRKRSAFLTFPQIYSKTYHLMCKGVKWWYACSKSTTQQSWQKAN